MNHTLAQPVTKTAQPVVKESYFSPTSGQGIIFLPNQWSRNHILAQPVTNTAQPVVKELYFSPTSE